MKVVSFGGCSYFFQANRVGVHTWLVRDIFIYKGWCAFQLIFFLQVCQKVNVSDVDKLGAQYISMRLLRCDSCAVPVFLGDYLCAAYAWAYLKTHALVSKFKCSSHEAGAQCRLKSHSHSPYLPAVIILLILCWSQDEYTLEPKASPKGSQCCRCGAVDSEDIIRSTYERKIPNMLDFSVSSFPFSLPSLFQNLSVFVQLYAAFSRQLMKR